MHVLKIAREQGLKRHWEPPKDIFRIVKHVRTHMILTRYDNVKKKVPKLTCAVPAYFAVGPGTCFVARVQLSWTPKKWRWR